MIGVPSVYGASIVVVVVRKCVQCCVPDLEQERESSRRAESYPSVSTKWPGTPLEQEELLHTWRQRAAIAYYYYSLIFCSGYVESRLNCLILSPAYTKASWRSSVWDMMYPP